MNRTLSAAAVALALVPAAAAGPPAPLLTGLKNPESVAVGPGGAVYVTVIGEFDRPGDGSVVKVENGKAVPFATGMNDPKGIAAYQKTLYVTDRDLVWSVAPSGEAKPFVTANAFPAPPRFLNDVVVDPESGTLYVTDSGDVRNNGTGGAVYRITPKGAVSRLVDDKTYPALKFPNGVVMDGASHLLVAVTVPGELHRVKIADGTAERVTTDLGNPDGLAWDRFGRLFVSDHPDKGKAGRLLVIPRPGAGPVPVATGLQGPSDVCLGADGATILVPGMDDGTLTAVPAVVPGAEVDTSPLPLKTAVAFPNLQFTGWEPETPEGKANPLRPIVLTHAGDGSNRVFVATQHGVVHSFANDPAATRTDVFLDISDRVQYSDKSNEEGFLGLAFHPRFKETGEFFAFYTPKVAKTRSNYVSRFRVRKDDPTKGDPSSEEVVFKFENRPFWNHDGGTVVFGPDGMLYYTHGDGGAANDPFDNGQNLGSPLGKILRIDVDRKDPGKNYAVPKDNPFVGKAGALPEVWAYGLRNVWRMSFDRKTGVLWAGEVGQNLYEEVNLIEKGGNYGWNRRESLHPFGAKGAGSAKDFIDPIWEYHHDVGRSITGGCVYRGSKVPELAGHYVYADYVSSKLWALKYDEGQKRVVANRPIKDPGRAFMSFGEDEQGEVYLLTVTASGKDGIHRYAK